MKNKRGQQIGSQITHDGFLLIDASVRPHGSATYYVSIGKPYQQKVYATGALYKIRKDDIAWENDRCAYRVYGPALQKTGERSFGTDIWVKNTPDTVVYERYIKDMNGNIKGDKIDARVRAMQSRKRQRRTQQRLLLLPSKSRLCRQNRAKWISSHLSILTMATDWIPTVWEPHWALVHQA